MVATSFVYVVVFVLGSAIGSFLSVVVHRVPIGQSIIHPPSRCPQCGQRLKPSENIPIWGWLYLKGRCSHCRTPIPIRYPLLEAVCGMFFVLIFALFGLTWETFGYWLFFSWLLALALIDIDTMTLPNQLTQSGLVAGLLFQAGIGLSVSPSDGINHVVEGILGAVMGLWLLDAIALGGSLILGQTAMGAGDAKLTAMMGAWIGWKLLLLAGFLACAIGAFAGGGAMAIGLLSRRQAFPFGPFLALGGMIAAIWGNAIVSLYLQLFFPTL